MKYSLLMMFSASMLLSTTVQASHRNSNISHPYSSSFQQQRNTNYEKRIFITIKTRDKNLYKNYSKDDERVTKRFNASDSRLKKNFENQIHRAERQFKLQSEKLVKQDAIILRWNIIQDKRVVLNFNKLDMRAVNRFNKQDAVYVKSEQRKIESLNLKQNNIIINVVRQEVKFQRNYYSNSNVLKLLKR